LTKQLNICLISREFLPDTAFGGMATFSLDLAKLLSARGHRVTVYSQALKQSAMLEIEGIVVKKLLLPGKWGSYSNLPRLILGFNWAINKAVMADHRKLPFDIIDAPDHLAEALFPAFLGSIPVVTRLHTPFSLIVDLGLNAYKKNLAYWLIRYAEKVALRRSAAIYSPTRDMLGHAQKLFGLSARQPSTIHGYPINRNVFRPASDDGLSKAADQPFTILVVGRLEHRKGVDLAALAFTSLYHRYGTSVAIKFIGADTCNMPDGESARSIIRRIAQHSRCENSIQFVEPISLTELAEEFRCASVLWVPSRYDNYPLVGLEALACGLPVIAAAVGGLTEIVENGANGLLFKSESSEQLQQQTATMIEDANLRARLSLGAVSYAEAHLSEEAVYQGTMSLYEQALARGN
jgi:glycosyltransferase involved in cell wall biosynthesis